MLTAQQKQLDSYSMMISSKYFKSKNDFINMICVNSKFKDTLEKFHYNPIPITNTNLFPNIETQYLYEEKDIILKDVNHHVVWFPVSYTHQQNEKNKNNNYIFKHVTYTPSPKNLNFNTIPSDCNTLGYFSGFCNSIQSIITPTNITSLKSTCFFNLKQLINIKLPTSLRILPYKCFSNCCSLKTIDISFITSIGNYCFSSCTSLTSITITKHIKYIGYNCFFNCNSLNDITVKEDINELLKNIPYHLSVILKQKNIECPNVYFTRDDVKLYGIKIPIVCNKLDKYCYYNQLLLNSIKIPTIITSIGSYCFSKCQNLISIQLPSTIKSLPDDCFSYSSSLKKINCLNVTSLDINCFYNCKSLTSITLTSNLKSIGRYCFLKCGLTSLSQFKHIDKILPEMLININCMKIDILNQFTSIKSSSFMNFTRLKELNISNNCKIIGGNCFSGCSQLTSIKLANYLVTLSNGCFQQCSSLKSIIIPTKVTRIGKACFSSCISLKEITIPESIKIIGTRCFFDCISLSSIKLSNLLTSIGKNCFKKCRSLQSITILTTVKLNEPIGDFKLNINFKKQNLI